MTAELKGARRSIRTHLILGLALMLVIAGGFGGWASTVQISGALIAPGSVVVDSNVTAAARTTRASSRLVIPGTAFCSSSIVGMPRSAAVSTTGPEL